MRKYFSLVSGRAAGADIARAQPKRSSPESIDVGIAATKPSATLGFATAVTGSAHRSANSAPPFDISKDGLRKAHDQLFQLYILLFERAEGRQSFACRRPDSGAKRWAAFPRRLFLPPNSPTPRIHTLSDTDSLVDIAQFQRRALSYYGPDLPRRSPLRLALAATSMTSCWESHATQPAPHSRPSSGEALSQRYRRQT
jgi:hypothetical protein